MATGNLHEIEYLVFHNYNVFLGKTKYFPGIHFSGSICFSLLMYLCLLPPSVTVKMDIGENMENARNTTNDDTADFMNQMKNRNTRKSEYDLIPYQAMLSDNDQLSQILRKTY